MKKASATAKSKTTRNARTSSNGSSSKTATKSPRKKSTTTANAQTDEETLQEERDTPLDKLFINLLQEMYWAEKNSTEAISTMQSQATTEELQDAFEDHMYATHKHVSRLEKVFAMLGREPQEKKCLAMEALAAEAEQMIAETEDGSMTRDAALIIAAQKVEHYEIATYGSLVQLALTLGYDNAASLLEKTLWEEEETDAMLTEIAECEVNPLADDEPQDVAMEESEEYQIEG